MRADRLGNLALDTGTQTLQSAMMLNEERIKLCAQLKEQNKEIHRLKKENELLEAAGAFFCCEPSEVGKNERMKFIAIKNGRRHHQRRNQFLLPRAPCNASGFL